MEEELVDPGVPTEDKAGPLLPAEETKMTPCLLTILSRASKIRLKFE